MNASVIKSSLRNDSIDILRFVAILGIIVIHCDPQSFFVRQLRNFDVPLMVFLAGVGFGLSFKRNKISYGQYVWKRFKRMVLPTWIFLLFLTIVTFVTTKSLPDKTWMIETFTLTTRDWYVWIIRVLFIMAIVAPLTIPYIDKSFTVKKYWIIGIVVLTAIELMPHSPEGLPLYLLLEFIPFFFVFVLGCEINHFTKKQLLGMAAASFSIYIIYAVVLYVKQSQLINTQIDKYPPHIYYLSYSLACITVLWVLKDKIVTFCDKLKITKLFCFIGSHTLWVYFWHIVLLHIMTMISGSFWIKFIGVGVGSYIFTYFQCKLLNIIVHHINNEKLRTNLMLIFNG